MKNMRIKLNIEHDGLKGLVLATPYMNLAISNPVYADLHNNLRSVLSI